MTSLLTYDKARHRPSKFPFFALYMSSWIVLSHWSIGTKFLSTKLWFKSLSFVQAIPAWAQPEPEPAYRPSLGPPEGWLRCSEPHWSHQPLISLPTPGSFWPWWLSLHKSKTHLPNTWKACRSHGVCILPIATAPILSPYPHPHPVNLSKKVSPWLGPDLFFIMQSVQVSAVYCFYLVFLVDEIKICIMPKMFSNISRTVEQVSFSKQVLKRTLV